MRKLKKAICLCLGAGMLLGSPVTSMAATQSGTYPTRKGTILVTPDAYKNLIPTGHAAMVWNSSNVIESLSGGVGVHPNNWKTKKKKIYGLTVKNTTTAQDKRAASWCKSQVGKKYNWNYFDVSTRKKFYCSQLVWASFKDLYNIDLNTSLFGKAIHPMELVNSNKTSIIYTYSK